MIVCKVVCLMTIVNMNIIVVFNNLYIYLNYVITYY